MGGDFEGGELVVLGEAEVDAAERVVRDRHRKRHVDADPAAEPAALVAHVGAVGGDIYRCGDAEFD